MFDLSVLGLMYSAEPEVSCTNSIRLPFLIFPSTTEAVAGYLINDKNPVRIIRLYSAPDFLKNSILMIIILSAKIGKNHVLIASLKSFNDTFH